jgi:hypothetical protein
MRTVLIPALLCSMAAIAQADGRLLILQPSAAQRLTPGDTVTVAWGEIGKDTEEQELLFSLDGGAHFRGITGKLGPTARSYQWTVPQTPSDHVVLVLRVGHDGRESVAGRSAVFSILLSAAVPAELAEPSASLANVGEAVWPPAPEDWEGEIPLRSGILGSRFSSVPNDAHCAEQGAPAFPDPGRGTTVREGQRSPSSLALPRTPFSNSRTYPLRQ